MGAGMRRRLRSGSQMDWSAAMALAWQASVPWVKQSSRLRQNLDLRRRPRSIAKD